MNRLSTGIAGVLLAVLSAAPAVAEPLSLALVPEPELRPDEVVRIQLEALRRNDAEDRGIAVAFRFASPENRRSTGPLARFASMIRNGPYRLMLGYLTAEYEPVERQGERARQRVTLVGAEISIAYVFYLSRQAEGPCEGCWMTDAVFLDTVPGRPA